MDQNLTLGYWPIRGLAQPIRFLLKYLEVPFNDKKYTNRDEWFNQDKPKFSHPFSNLPYLVDGEQVIFESEAIALYILQKLNRLDLLGVDQQQKVKVAQVRGVISDVKFRLGAIWYNKENHEALKQQFMPIVSQKFQNLDQFMGENQFLTGNTITVIDFAVWEVVDAVLQFEPSVFTELKNLKGFHQRLAEIPQIKAYMASNEYLSKPFNNPAFAAWSG